MFKIAVAQIGARRHYAIPSILHSAGRLDALYTDICANLPALRLLKSIWPERIAPSRLRKLLAREVKGVPASKIRCFPCFALSRILRRERADSTAALTAAHLRNNEEFGRRVVARGLGDADTVYVFNGAALEILEHAQHRGLNSILEQTSAPAAVEHRLRSEERTRWPGWEPDDAVADILPAVVEREEREWELADRIFCGSEFVRDALTAHLHEETQCTVIPYGVNVDDFRISAGKEQHAELRVLYAGSANLLKGVQYLHGALGLVKSQHIVCRAVGPVQLTQRAQKELAGRVELVGAVPRSEIARHYHWADVLVLPTLCEGSANVCYEALAAGLPVVTTPHAGSVIRDGCEGFVVSIRSTESLAARIDELAGDRGLLAALAEAARARANEFTWDAYSARLLAAIEALPCPAPSNQQTALRAAASEKRPATINSIE